MQHATTPHSDPTVYRADELAAASLAVDGGPLARAKMGVGALRKLMADPEDTSQVFVLGLAVNHARFPQFLAAFTGNDDGMRLVKEQPSIDTDTVDYDALRALPETTLGGAYARFLDSRGLTPDIFRRPPGLPEMVGFVAQRMRQCHDIWHVVTGYGTEVDGELPLLAFSWAQTNMPSPALIALVGTLRWLPQQPNLPSLVAEGYRRGKRAAYLPTVIWEDRWEQPLDELRQELEIPPLRARS